LVCLDRSARAEASLPLATYIAQIHGARMTFVHILDSPPDAAEVRATDALEWEIIRQDARAYLDRWVEEVERYGIEAEGRIAEGPAARCVSELSSSLDVDLLVLSSRGESQTDTWDLGGTARKILALSNIPTLVVPSGPDEPSTHVPPRRIFVPLDGSVRSECVLPTAIRIARESDAEVIVGHIVSDPIRTEVLFNEGDLSLARSFANTLSTRAGEYLDRIGSQLEASGVKARTALSRSIDHREELVALAAAERADMIILSAHGATCNPRHHYGSVTSHVVAHSRIPVLVVHDLPAATTEETVDRSSRLPLRSIDATFAGG
jgi:nucleotide-binding universal stress UspA family protein